MISRSGTRTSGASSGVTKILREAGRGPVVTAGFSSVDGIGLFMVLLPSGGMIVRSMQVAKKAKQQSEHEPDRGGDGREVRLTQHGVAGLHHEQRPEQPQRAADRAEPAQDRDQHAPVPAPDIV